MHENLEKSLKNEFIGLFDKFLDLKNQVYL